MSGMVASGLSLILRLKRKDEHPLVALVPVRSRQHQKSVSRRIDDVSRQNVEQFGLTIMSNNNHPVADRLNAEGGVGAAEFVD